MEEGEGCDLSQFSQCPVCWRGSPERGVLRQPTSCWGKPRKSCSTNSFSKLFCWINYKPQSSLSPWETMWDECFTRVWTGQSDDRGVRNFTFWINKSCIAGPCPSLCPGTILRGGSPMVSGGGDAALWDYGLPENLKPTPEDRMKQMLNSGHFESLAKPRSSYVPEVLPPLALALPPSCPSPLAVEGRWNLCLGDHSCSWQSWRLHMYCSILPHRRCFSLIHSFQLNWKGWLLLTPRCDCLAPIN